MMPTAFRERTTGTGYRVLQYRVRQRLSSSVTTAHTSIGTMIS